MTSRVTVGQVTPAPDTATAMAEIGHDPRPDVFRLSADERAHVPVRFERESAASVEGGALSVRAAAALAAGCGRLGPI